MLHLSRNYIFRVYLITRNYSGPAERVRLVPSRLTSNYPAKDCISIFFAYSPMAIHGNFDIYGHWTISGGALHRKNFLACFLFWTLGWCPHCTMVLAIEIKERKICKSKWLDFTHFSTNYYFFGLYCCETANI